jgi:hypothetical protein
MHAIQGTAVSDDAQGNRAFKPSAHLAEVASATPISSRLLGLVTAISEGTYCIDKGLVALHASGGQFHSIPLVTQGCVLHRVADRCRGPERARDFMIHLRQRTGSSGDFPLPNDNKHRMEIALMGRSAHIMRGACPLPESVAVSYVDSERRRICNLVEAYSAHRCAGMSLVMLLQRSLS